MCLGGLWQVLNNTSVGAFLGSASAFGFILLYDWIKDQKRVRQIANDIQRAASQIEPKRDALKRDLIALKSDDPEVRGGQMLPFGTEPTKRLLAEVRAHLGTDEQRAVDAILFRMDGIDADIAAAGSLCEDLFFDRELKQPKSQAQFELLPRLYTDSITNLNVLEQQVAHYVAKRFDAVLFTKLKV